MKKSTPHDGMPTLVQALGQVLCLFQLGFKWQPRKARLVNPILPKRKEETKSIKDKGIK